MRAAAANAAAEPTPHPLPNNQQDNREREHRRRRRQAGKHDVCFHCVNHGIIYEKTLFIAVIAQGVDVVVRSTTPDYAHRLAAIIVQLPFGSLWI